MAEISLNVDSLIVDSFETTDHGTPGHGTIVPGQGQPGDIVPFYTDASARPCSRCCPED